MRVLPSVIFRSSTSFSNAACRVYITRKTICRGDRKKKPLALDSEKNSSSKYIVRSNVFFSAKLLHTLPFFLGGNTIDPSGDAKKREESLFFLTMAPQGFFCVYAFEASFRIRLYYYRTLTVECVTSL